MANSTGSFSSQIDVAEDKHTVTRYLQLLSWKGVKVNVAEFRVNQHSVQYNNKLKYMFKFYLHKTHIR